MSHRVVVLGAGFAGLELATVLSEALGDELDLVLVDRSDSFYFGYSKLDVMFGRALPQAVCLPYTEIRKPGVRFLQATVTGIDPEARRVTTDRGPLEADVLVVALGADYDLSYTPGLAEGGHEFYSFEGAARLRDVIPTFTRGHAVIGVTSAPFKCPPAPSEAALLLHDDLVRRGVRGDCEISLVMPFGTPIPPSPATSVAILEAFRERGIAFVADRSVAELDPERRVAILDDESEMPYDLFLGIPMHRVPEVVAASGMTEFGWIPVDPRTLETRWPDVYAVGDVNSVGTPKAGVFAEGAARTVAERIISRARGTVAPYRGLGTCYVEFGSDLVARVDVEFLAGPPTGTYTPPSPAVTEEKRRFGSTRRQRWFGMT